MNTITRIPAISTQQRKIHTPDSSEQLMTIDSKTLFTQGDVVFILHRGERYLLRCTRNGKLILTK